MTSIFLMTDFLSYYNTFLLYTQELQQSIKRYDTIDTQSVPRIGFNQRRGPISRIFRKH